MLTGAKLQGAKLAGADLMDADLTDATIDVEECAKRGWLRGVIMGAADWSGKDLRDAKLEKINLAGSNLSRANLNGADMNGANLAGSNLEGATLRKTSLFEAVYDVQVFAPKGWLKGAMLGAVNWQSQKLIGAQLQVAVMRQTTSL